MALSTTRRLERCAIASRADNDQRIDCVGLDTSPQKKSHLSLKQKGASRSRHPSAKPNKEAPAVRRPRLL